MVEELLRAMWDREEGRKRRAMSTGTARVRASQKTRRIEGATAADGECRGENA
jgi:hypothetical protein